MDLDIRRLILKTFEDHKLFLYKRLETFIKENEKYPHKIREECYKYTEILTKIEDCITRLVIGGDGVSVAPILDHLSNF